MRTSTAFLLLCAQVALSAALPLVGEGAITDSLVATDSMDRDERKAGGLDTENGPFEFVRELQNQIAFPDGRPKNPEQDPTAVWYILDKDLVEGNYRPTPDNDQKCSSVSRFVFSWETMAEACEEKVLPVRSAMLRTYLHVIPRLLRQKPSVEVDISTSVRPLSINGTATNESVLAGHKQIIVTASSNEWIMLNITDGIQALWPANKEGSLIEVTVTLNVNCHNQKKVPASLVDPASISLDTPKRRERHMNLQPILLVFTDDEEVRQKMVADSEEKSPEADVLNGENATLSSNRADRAVNSPCGIEDFSIRFTSINLPHFRIPTSYNARKCTGSCHHTTLKRQPGLGNNHAKLMASAHLASQQSGHTLYQEVPPLPCCVPIRYSPISVIMQLRDGWKSEVFASMIVEECGCR